MAKELYAFGDEYRLEYHLSIPDATEFYKYEIMIFLEVVIIISSIYFLNFHSVKTTINSYYGLSSIVVCSVCHIIVVACI